MAIRCKTKDCENTFLNSDRFICGYCQDCQDRMEEENEENMHEMQK